MNMLPDPGDFPEAFDDESIPVMDKPICIIVNLLDDESREVYLAARDWKLRQQVDLALQPFRDFAEKIRGYKGDQLSPELWAEWTALTGLHSIPKELFYE